jgi:CubicO group peptidase (beta-lactamase class C family)
MAVASMPLAAAQPAQAAAGGPDAALASSLDAYAARAREDWEVPGLALAVVKDGRVLLARGYGVRDLERPEPVDEHTLFAIGSTTKAMTAALLAQLVAEGMLAWDDPVVRHLPGFQLRDPWATREVTVRDLLTHRAGLGNADLLWYGSDRSRDEVLAAVPRIEPAYSPRSGFVYQNVMYAVAGELAARLAGRPWEELLAQRLFAPLGMERSAPTLAAAGDRDNVGAPHDRVDGTLRRIENEPVDSIAAAGAVWSSVADLSRWLRALLAEGQWEGRQVLAAETVADLLAPQTLIPRGSFGYPTVELTRPHWTTYGFGWFQQDYQGLMVQYHTGSIDGMSALVGVVPDRELGVAVLANRDHAELRHALLWRAVDLFAGAAPPRDWSAELRELYGKAEAERERARAEQERKRVPGTRPTLDLAGYAGRYEHPLLGALEVRHEDGRLRLLAGARLTGPLEHWHYDTFRVRWDRAWQGRELVVFQLDAAGRPARLVFRAGEWTRSVEPAQ